MRYEELAPPAELRGLVHRFWVLRGRAPAGVPFQRAMPDGRAELIFNLGDPFECCDGGDIRAQPLALLVGPSLRAMAIRPTGRVDLVGIRFRPEALAAWLRVGGSELAGMALALDEIPAPLDATLAERLGETPGNAARLGIIRRQLAPTALRAEDGWFSAAVDLVLGGPEPADTIAWRMGVSRRQLRRLFRERIGIAPKPLARLGRFQRTLRALEADPRVPLAGVAVRAGYFDQAHMSRDFRLFAGTTPAGYRREARELTRHFLDTPG